METESHSTYEGGCHCGNIHFTLQLQRPATDYQARACQCSFCRKHNASYISDPEATLTIRVKEREKLTRYQFASQVVDFLICKHCGVLPGALREINGHLYGVVNIQTLDSDIADQITIQPLNYDGEAEKAKDARHQERWISNVSLLME